MLVIDEKFHDSCYRIEYLYSMRRGYNFYPETVLNVKCLSSEFVVFTPQIQKLESRLEIYHDYG